MLRLLDRANILSSSRASPSPASTRRTRHCCPVPRSPSPAQPREPEPPADSIPSPPSQPLLISTSPPKPGSCLIDKWAAREGRSAQKEGRTFHFPSLLCHPAFRVPVPSQSHSQPAPPRPSIRGGRQIIGHSPRLPPPFCFFIRPPKTLLSLPPSSPLPQSIHALCYNSSALPPLRSEHPPPPPPHPAHSGRICLWDEGDGRGCPPNPCPARPGPALPLALRLSLPLRFSSLPHLSPVGTVQSK